MPGTLGSLHQDGSILMRPIGRARSAVRSQQTGGFVEIESRIDLEPHFEAYLQGLEQYSHLLVVFWMHEQKSPKATTRPQGHPGVPEVGMFACR